MATDSHITKGCTQCGGERRDEGFIPDDSGATTGVTSWISGLPEFGMLGSVKRSRGQKRLAITAFRCFQCGHLELYVLDGEGSPGVRARLP